MRVDTSLATEIVRAAAFRTALRRFLRRTDESAAAAGLSGQRYNLLLMLKAAQLEREPPTVTALIERLELPQTAVSELVRRAEEAGLVRRRRSSDDGRMRVIELTADGERRFLHAFTNLRADREELAAGLRDIGRRFDQIQPRERTHRRATAER